MYNLIEMSSSNLTGCPQQSRTPTGVAEAAENALLLSIKLLLDSRILLTSADLNIVERFCPELQHWSLRVQSQLDDDWKRSAFATHVDRNPSIRGW